MRNDQFPIQAAESLKPVRFSLHRSCLCRLLLASGVWFTLAADTGDARAQGFIDDYFETRSGADGVDDLPPFDGQTVAGAQFPHSVLIDNLALKLVGAGARKESRLVMYSMGFYIRDPHRAASELIEADELTLIRLETVTPLITPARFAKAVTLGFEKSTNGEQSRFEAEINQFLGALKGRLKRGEVMELIYVPGEGTQVLRNGELLTTVAGLEFKQALFRIWLGDDPIDVALKEDLLGGVQ